MIFKHADWEVDHAFSTRIGTMSSASTDRTESSGKLISGIGSDGKLTQGLFQINRNISFPKEGITGVSGAATCLAVFTMTLHH